MPRGYLALILHAHLPYVRHPEHESFLEESWLFEAITETYIPLLQVFERLLADGVRFRLTLSLSPPLVAMLRDPFLQWRYRAHLDKLIGLATSEVARTRGDRRFHGLARGYLQLFEQTARAFAERYRGDLVSAFAELQAAGVLELITTAATHGYLPLLRTQPVAVRAQLEVGADSHRRAIGRPALGVWLPECGYYPGLEGPVEAAGFGYFIVDTHGILNGSVRPRYGILAPVGCANGLAAFGRDPDTSRQVWSAQEGYPGDVHYRDFYRDIGFDLDLEYLRPYVLDGGTRVHTGIKYYRITGPTNDKAPYDPARASRQAQAHAEHFLGRLLMAIDARAAHMDRPPLITAPYDAELFGHWWFEGPQWLEHLVRQAALQAHRIELITPSDYLYRHPRLQLATPSASSWGEKGYNEYWLNEGTAWIYPHLQRAAERLHQAARDHRMEPSGTLVHRTVQQAARSLLLAQASDWAFIIRTGTAVEYAHRRLRDHLSRFSYLLDSLRGPVDERRLRALEYMDNIFPHLDYSVYT
jgi:1,4-alpha-glucan branching enzyme